MAYVPAGNQTDPNDPNKPLDPNAPTAPQGAAAAPQTSSSVAGAAGAAGGAGQGAPASPNASTAPPVQNLQDYLTANQPQAVQMGKDIAGKLTADATQLSGDINADQTALDAAIQAQHVKPDQALVGRAAANPNLFVQDPNDVAAFGKQRDAKYTGPSTVEALPSWQALRQRVNDTVSKAPDVSNMGGFLQLASQMEKNPTAGMTNLDASLLSSTPDAAQPILDAAAPYKALPGQFQTATDTENSAISQTQLDDLAAAGLIDPAFFTGPNAAVPAWEKALTDSLGTATNNRDAYNTAVNTTVGNANTSRNALENARSTDTTKINQGVVNTGNAASDAAWRAKILGYINPSSYESQLDPFLNLQPMTAAPTMESVASADDYTREAALEQLLGNTFSGSPINQSTKDKAGTFTVPGMPGAIPDLSGQPSYMNDITSLYTSTKAPFLNANVGGVSSTQTPIQHAQRLLQLGQQGGQGVTLDPTITAYLNRIIANSYVGR